MAGFWTNKYSYIDGDFISVNEARFILVDDNLAAKSIPHTLFSIFNNNEVEGTGLNWSGIGVCICPENIRKTIVVGYMGEVAEFIGINLDKEYKIENVNTLGPLRGLELIDEEMYVFGIYRQVYRRKKDGLWQNISGDIIDQSKSITGFEALSAYSTSEIYTVGRQGEIWFFNGLKWSQISSPTNLLLTSVCCCTDGYVYIGGQDGILLKGKDNLWEVIEQDVMFDWIWDIVEYNNELYFFLEDYMVKMRNSSLVVVDDFDEETPFSFFKGYKVGNKFYTVGYKDVMSLDVNQWTRID